MQPETQSNQPQSLPQLNLSEPQKAVVNAHAAQAFTMIVAIGYTGDATQQHNAMLNAAFEQGKLFAYRALLTYDQDTLNNLTEGAQNA